MLPIRSRLHPVVLLLLLAAITSNVQCLSPVLTPQSVQPPTADLYELSQKSSRKWFGSKGYHQAWSTWLNCATKTIRYQVSQNLAHPVDVDATKKLEWELGNAADHGQMPCFSHAGSRSGYALDFLACRVRRLARVLLPIDATMVNDGILERLGTLLLHQDECKVTSIGGGPGYDYVAMCLVAVFLNIPNSRTRRQTRIQGIVFDYEPGWSDVVHTMEQSTNTVLSDITGNLRANRSTDNSCKFGGKCDITKSLNDPVNAACGTAIASTDLFVCQYCVAENAQKLRESDFVFFRNAFEQASEGTIFVVSEVTHRLWPDLVQIVEELGGFDVTFVPSRSEQLVLEKKAGSRVSSQIISRCADMRLDDKRHNHKLKNGFVRPIRKVRGAKL